MSLSVLTQAQSVMSRHVRDAVRNGQAQANGPLPSDQIMSLDIVLPLRNQAALDTFLSELYNPTTANYRHFLTVAEFTARFGPTQQDYDDVLNFARLNGFQVTGGSRDGMDVQARGPVSAVERAFHVHMRIFGHPSENRTFYSPDSEPTTDLPFNLWHISGLDNYSIPRPLVVKKSDYAKANGIDANAVVPHATTGSGPSASFLGTDMRAAYYGSGSLNGAGQNLGLLEYLGTDLDDLNTYYKNVNQTYNVPITLLSVDGTSVSCTKANGNCDDTEQTLDMTQALGMAPGLASLTMYIGSSDTAIISAMTTHNPLPTTIGCSWGWTPVDPNTLDPYFKRMAAQGQTFFAASGDSSTWSWRNQSWPADDPYIVSVGGTDLVTTGAGGAWASETAWVDSGGGITPNNIAIPSWQQISGVINSSNTGSTTLRNGPDVSANANFAFYTCANQTSCLANTYGGTSFAAPMWAAFLALANQQMASAGPLGFINPTIYAQNVTSSYSANFHDITSGTSGSYSAVPGYDLVTGWGSPTAALIDALTGSSTGTQAFTVSASPSSLSITAGNSGSSTITTTVSGGFNSTVALSASGMPAGVKVSFSPASIGAPGSGSSTATFTAASNTVPGTYNITITATGNGLTQTTSVSLTVAPATQPAFTLAASSGSVTLRRSASGSVTITTTVSGGFNSTISLSASGQGGGQFISFSPNPIAAPGAGAPTMTITASKNAVLGTRTITITATGGGVPHTTTVNLTVTR